MDLNFTTGEDQKNRKPTKQWSEGEAAAKIKELDDKIEDSVKNQGEIEVRDAILDKAEFYCFELRDFVEAEKVFREAYKKTGGPSKKMEILFEILLMNIEKEDTLVMRKDIAECHKLIEEGGDWDKKNKLKIFEGVYCMMIRDFKKASDLFVNSVATFTAVEVMSMKEFVFYTVVLSLLI